MAADRTAPAADPKRDTALAEIARVHLGFGSLASEAGDDRDFREVAVWHVKASLRAAYEAGREPAKLPAVERAPDCTTSRAAQVAGVLASAVMAGEASLLQASKPEIAARMPALDDGEAWHDFAEGLRVACLMIEARARASVRTPSQAAVSGAAAALAVIEDALAGPAEGEDVPDLFAVAEAARDLLRAALHPDRSASPGA